LANLITITKFKPSNQVKKILLYFALFFGASFLQAQNHEEKTAIHNKVAEATIISELDLSKVPSGKITKYWLHIISSGLSQPVLVPVMVAKGKKEGPVLGLVAALHGNELNGIPVIQKVFEGLDINNLEGTVVGIPGLNAIGVNNEERRFNDGIDLNRGFPGKENGNRSQQYIHRTFQKLVRHFDYLIDMHTASFGRLNSLYVRADLRNDTIAKMARLHPADILLNSKGIPSTGDAIPMLRTLRAEAMLAGIPTITIEYGNPQVYQNEMIDRGVVGIQNILAHLKLTSNTIEEFSPVVLCKKSYWTYTDEGGLLEVLPDLAQKVQKGEKIAILKNPFGDILAEYFAPESGIIIGKSSNPVNQHGGRILHLGILEDQ